MRAPVDDLYPDGGLFTDSGCDGPWDSQSADLAFRTYVDTEGSFKPDGRIRVNFGTWIGGNIYNATGEGQSRSGEASRRNWVLFRIGIQNDGIFRDRFFVDADGASASGYRVRYFRKTNEITSAVVAGTYRTPWLKPGKRVTIEAWVKVKSTATKGSQVERLITIASASESERVDAVKFTARRK